MVTDDTTDDRDNDSGHVGTRPQARVGCSPPMRDIRPGVPVHNLSAGVHLRSTTHRSASVVSTDYDAGDELLTPPAVCAATVTYSHASLILGSCREQAGNAQQRQPRDMTDSSRAQHRTTKKKPKKKPPTKLPAAATQNSHATHPATEAAPALKFDNPQTAKKKLIMRSHAGLIIRH